MSQYRAPWSEEEMALLKQGADAGMTDEEISRQLLPHRTPGSVDNKRSLLRESGPNYATPKKMNPARLRCLGCGCPFDSWDRVRNRLCETCRKVSDGRVSYGVVVGF